SPSIGEALRRILLSPGARPAGADASLGGKRLLALARAGFADEAREISSLATVGRGDLYVAEADATVSLLNGEDDAACRRSAGLTSGREAPFWVRLRAYCYARAGELDAFDLTMNLLREGGDVSPSDEAYLLAAATKAPPKALPPIETELQYAAAKTAKLPIGPAQVADADAGVLKAIALDGAADAALRLSAAMDVHAMGVGDAGVVQSLFDAQQFDVAELGNAVAAAAGRPADPLADALLYQSIKSMTAPEFIRDKAQRIAIALGRADSFARAYALSALYAGDIEALEGVIVAPSEASKFALARMMAGDAAGAGAWLTAMIGSNESVGALPEDLGAEFIDRVGQLALLDPQTAAAIARRGGVSMLSDEPDLGGGYPRHDDPAAMARILDAAFDAVAEGKAGQAGLAALAASAGRGPAGGDIEAVVVKQGLEAAGLPDLGRRQLFERALIAGFGAQAAAVAAAAPSQEEPTGLMPRVKPPKGQ
ncbi:MAG: hypothetical protein R3C58_15950, partial [Parvularculaceae bacterium]